MLGAASPNRQPSGCCRASKLLEEDLDFRRSVAYTKV